jgi:hypothetical protein
MPREITIALSEEEFDRLKVEADRAGIEPSEWAAGLVVGCLPKSSKPGGSLRRFAGSLTSPNPRGVDNELIDEDLAREYAGREE